jgi:hypothetical protein
MKPGEIFTIQPPFDYNMKILNLTVLLAFAVQFSGMPLPEKKKPTFSPAVVKHLHGMVHGPEDEEYIPWLDSRRLGWEDFQGEPRSQNEAVASTSTSLGISYQVKNNRLNYQITCNFSKVKSWGLLKTDYILAHEQGHFDITELYARRMHEALSSYKFNKKTFRADVNKIYQEVVKGKEAMQATYDGETDHSRNRRQQMLWLSKIEKMMEETSVYSNYP